MINGLCTTCQYPLTLPPSPPSTEMKKPKWKHRKKRKTQVVKEKKYILRRHCWCMTRKCSLCGKKFANTQALNIHVTDEHEYKFLCKFRKCRSEYSSQTLADCYIYSGHIQLGTHPTRRNDELTRHAWNQ